MKKCATCGRKLSKNNRSGVCLQCQRHTRAARDGEVLVRRECLRCSQAFEARGRFERLCQDCKGSPAFKEQREPSRVMGKLSVIFGRRTET